MENRNIEEYLEREQIGYKRIHHMPAYTAQEVAHSAHIRGHEVVKTVIVKLDDELAMVVLHADERVDFDRLRRTTGADRVQLADEAEFKGRFPDCEVGAMPPFGNLYGMPVYMSSTLKGDEEIAFNACSHTDLIRLPVAEYVRLVHPEVRDFAV